MATKKKDTLKTFSVTGRINKLDIRIEIKAPSLEEAIIKAREKKFTDFVETAGDVFDYEGPEILSVWLND
jgi:hypothetical protein